MCFDEELTRARSVVEVLFPGGPSGEALATSAATEGLLHEMHRLVFFHLDGCFENQVASRASGDHGQASQHRVLQLESCQHPSPCIDKVPAKSNAAVIFLSKDPVLAPQTPDLVRLFWMVHFIVVLIRVVSGVVLGWEHHSGKWVLGASGATQRQCCRQSADICLMNVVSVECFVRSWPVH